MKSIKRKLTFTGAIYFMSMSIWMMFKLLDTNSNWYYIFPLIIVSLASADMFDDYFMAIK